MILAWEIKENTIKVKELSNYWMYTKTYIIAFYVNAKIMKFI